MGSFNVKKKAEPQKENAYILYMMIGSLFAKTYCRTEVMEEKLYLSYVEMNRNTQETREKQVISAAENALGSIVCDLSDIQCEAYIVSRGDRFYLDFLTGFEEVHVEVDPKGGYIIELL